MAVTVRLPRPFVSDVAWIEGLDGVAPDGRVTLTDENLGEWETAAYVRAFKGTGGPAMAPHARRALDRIERASYDLQADA